jgi:NADH-quinone oxidoreductase subunit H
MFYLGEYVNTVTVASIAVTLFLGGWQGPAPHVLHWLWPLLWFLAKVTGVMYVFILIRATLPRMRYDRLMAFGWKVLIPFGLVWVLVTAFEVILPDHFARRQILLVGGAVCGVVILASLLAPLMSRKPEPAEVSP